MQASAPMIRGEMEYEFSDQEGGQFLATGKVVAFLRSYLAKGEIDQAVALYESCVENVGDALFLEFKVASKTVQKAMANLFYRARDYRRAAAACEIIGEWGAAARAYEAALEWPKAAECHLRVGAKDRAAAMLQKAGDHRRAAELYFESGDLASAASVLAGAGDFLGAARLSLRAGDKKRAAQELAQVPPSDASYPQALSELADLLVELGRRDLAIQRLLAAVPRDRRVRDAGQAELAYRLGVTLGAAGRPAEAAAAFEMVRAWNPQFKDVAARLASLPADQALTMGPRIPGATTGRGTTTGATVPGPLAGSTTGAVPTAPLSVGRDPFAALDASGGATVAAEAPVDTGYVTRMQGYELLKTLPIFEDLSLDEMKDFYRLCEHVTFEPGEVVIEQGRAGQGLVIVRQGTLDVVTVEPSGAEKPLARLPAGKYVGEMSLIDESPTSARVKAAERVSAFRIKKDAFRAYLYTHDLVAMRVYRSFTRTLSERLRETNARLTRG